VRDGRLGQLEMGRGHNGHGGAFFVSSGVLFYLYLADVSVPLLGTNFAETPLISAALSSISSSSCSVSILGSLRSQRLEIDPMHLSRRCGARTRRGSQCRSPAMPNGRCRMHGGLSPGAPKGNKNALKR
jgi:hypothetical protein